MALNLGHAEYTAGLDWSGLRSGLDQADNHFQNWTGRVSGSVQRVGEVAMGVLVAQAIPAIINGFSNMAKQAIGVTASLQQMQIGMEGLLAREISKGDEVIKTRRVRVELTAKEREKLQDLNLQRDKLNAKLQEETERHRQLTERWGAEGLAVKTHATDMAILRDKLDDTSAAIAGLEGKQGSLATVTEKSRINTKSLSDAMPEAQSRAKKLMDELARTAILSPYQLDVVNNTFKQAMAFGYTSDEASKLTKAMLNVGAGVGAGNEQLGRMSYNFAQIRMVGKVTALDVRQLAMAGFDLNSVLQYTGEKFHLTINSYEDFNKAIASGKITWAQFTDAFAEYADKNFGGASERMARSLQGLKSTFSDLFALTMPQIVGPALEAVTDRLSKLLDLFLGVRESGVLEGMGKSLGAWVEKALGPMDRFLDYLESAKQMQSQMARLGLGPVAQPDMLGGALRAAFGQGIMGPLTAVRETLAAIGQAFGVIRDAVSRAWTVLRPVVETLGEKIGSFVQLKDVVAGMGIILATALVPALLSAVGALLAFLAPIAAIVAGVALLRTAWEQNWGDIQKRVAAVVATVKDYFSLLVMAFQTGGLPAVGQKLGEWWGQLQNYLVTNAPLWGEQIKGVMAQVWAKLTTSDTGGATGFGQFVSELQPVIQKLQDIFGPTVERLKTTFAGLGAQFEEIKPKLKALGEAVAPVIAAVAVFATKLGSEFLAGALSRIMPIIGGVADAFTGIFNILSGKMSVLDGLEQTIGGLLTVLDNLAGVLWDTLVNTVNDIFGTSLKSWDEFKKMIEDAVEAAKDSILAMVGRWIEAGAALIEGIKTGVTDAIADVKEFFAGIGESIVQAVKDFFGIASPSSVFAELGGFLMDGLIAGVGGMLEAVKTKLGEIKAGILAVFEKPLEILQSIGANIIEGLKQGIVGAWEGLKAKVLELIAQLPAGVRRFLGIESPSRVFAEIGDQAMQGLAVGFTTGATDATSSLLRSLRGVIDALADWQSVQANVSRLTSATAVTDPLAQMIDNLTRIADGLQALALIRVPVGVDVRIKALLLQLTTIVTVLADFADTGVKQGDAARIHSAKAVTDPLAMILNNLQEIVGGFAAMSETAFDLAAIDAALPKIVTGLTSIVKQMATLGENLADVDVGMALAVAGVLSEVVEPFERAAQALGVIADLMTKVDADWTATAWTDALTWIKAVLFRMASDMQALNVQLGEIPFTLTQFAGQVAALVEPFGAAATAIGTVLGVWLATPVDLRDVRAGQGKEQVSGWQSALDWLTNVLAEIQRNMAMLQDRIGPIADDLVTFARNLGDLTAPFEAAARALAALFDISAFVGQGTGGPRATERSSRAAPWQRSLTLLREMLLAIHGEITGMWRVLGEIPQELTDFTAALGAIGSALTDAVKFLVELDTWRASNTIRTNFTTFSAAWLYVLDQIDYLRRRTTVTLSDDLIKFTAALGAIGTGLQGAIGFITELTAWEEVRDVRTQIDGLVAALDYLLDKLKPVTAKWQTDGLKTATEFGQAVSAVMGGLQAALQIVLALPKTWTAPAASVWDPFFDWALAVFESFAKRVVEWTGGSARIGTGGEDVRIISAWLTKDNLDLVGLVANAFGAVFGGLQAALQLAVAVPSKWRVPDPAIWEPFFDWALSVFESFAKRVIDWTGGSSTWSSTFGDVKVSPAWLTKEHLDLIGLVAGAFGGVMNGLRGALDLAVAVPSKWRVPSWDIWDPFFDWALSVFETFAKRVIEWTSGGVSWSGVSGDIRVSFPWLTKDQLDLVGLVASAFGGVMNGLQAALQLAVAVPSTWQIPSPAIWDPFFDWATAVFESFVQRVIRWTKPRARGRIGQPTEQLPAFIDPDQLDLVSAVVGAFGNVFGGLRAGLELALADWDTLKLPNLETTMTGFIDWVGGVFARVADYIKAKWPTTTAETFEPVTAFGGALSAVMGGLQSALELLKGLMWFVAPAEDRITAFMGGVKLVIDKITAGAAGVLTQAQATAATTFGQTLQTLLGALQSALSLFEALAGFDADTSPSGKFAKRLETFNEALTLALDSWRDWIVNKLEKDAAQLVAAFAPVIQQIADGFQSGLNLLGALNEAGIPTTERLQQFLDLILKLFGDFTAALKTVVNSDDWTVLGKDMLGGMIVGINAEKPRLLEAARAASYDAYLEVKKALGIASPSKVFAGLGVEIPAGVVQGIEQGQARLERAVAGMFRGVQAPDVRIDARREAHIYLHADGDLGGLGASGTQDLVQSLADYMRLGGLRVAVS